MQLCYIEFMSWTILHSTRTPEKTRKELMKLCMKLDKKSDCLQTIYDADYFWK